jgi:hypothetical protein
LICPLCKKLFTDAVLIACCGATFCDKCIRPADPSELIQCPNCHKYFAVQSECSDQNPSIPFPSNKSTQCIDEFSRTSPQSKLLPNHNIRKLVLEHKAKQGEEQAPRALPTVAAAKSGPLVVRLTKDVKTEVTPLPEQAVSPRAGTAHLSFILQGS